MRFSVVSIGLLALITHLTSAWSKDDQEIFRVRDELALHEGPNVSFYDFLGVMPSASQDEINRAYRKKTKALHPDKVKQQLAAVRATKSKSKNKDKKKSVTVTKPPTQAEIRSAVKAAGERQARLSLVANILRGPGRERYDHFVANGFPVWKGTGYYYTRFRPGLGTVLVGCFAAGGGAFHYIFLYMSWKRQREFVERYIKFARHAAWGENFGIPGVDGPAAPSATPPADDEQAPLMPMNRKQRRMQERDARRESAKDNKRMGRGRVGRSSGSATPVPQTQPNNDPGPTGAKKRVVAENGKILVVDSLGDVYLEQEEEDGSVQEFLLDPNEFPMPTFKDTAVWRLPIWAFKRVLGKKGDAGESSDEELEESTEQLTQDEDDSDVLQRTPSTDSAEDFEMLNTSQSVDDLAKTATGSQQTGGKAKKRNKKR